jgi:glutamate racemase
LACTHYPLIKDEIAEFYEGRVEVIDTGSLVADYLYDKLSEAQLLEPTENPVNRFFVSDYTQGFTESAKRFFGEKINLEEAHIW